MCRCAPRAPFRVLPEIVVLRDGVVVAGLHLPRLPVRRGAIPGAALRDLAECVVTTNVQRKGVVLRRRGRIVRSLLRRVFLKGRRRQ